MNPWQRLTAPMTEDERRVLLDSLAAIGRAVGHRPVAVKAILAEVSKEIERGRKRRKSGHISRTFAPGRTPQTRDMR
jgi:hypothetical protein